jgi:acyl-coenzyme A thioesterase PaaI-like protein
MAFTNNMTRAMRPFQTLPASLRQRAISLILGRYVPYVGTSGLLYEEITETRVVVSIKNRRKVQNHIKTVHAAAMALLAETASGFVVGVNLPDDRLPLIKTLKIDYTRRSSGDLRAVATLTPADIERIRNEPKGEVLVPVVLTDATGEQPVICEMLWAWTSKKR